MSRKEPSFGQLMTYVTRDAADVRFHISHNMGARDHATTIADFEANARVLAKREGGVVVFHEIVSIQRSTQLTLDEQKEILRDITMDYLKARAPGCLAFGALHDDHTRHLHYHLVISANQAGERRRHRLTKADFNQIKIALEARVLALYPKLEQGVAMNKVARRKLSQRGEALKHRVGRVPQRDRVEVALKAAFAKATSQQDLFDRLTDGHLELYRRGKAVTVIDHTSGRKHRLSTLGLDADYAAMTARLDQMAQAEARLRAIAVQAPAVTQIAKTVSVATAQTLAPPQLQNAPVIQRSMPPPVRTLAPPQPIEIATAQAASPAQPAKETNVNIMDALTQGFAAIIDAASIKPPTTQPVEAADHQSERDRIAAERLAEVQARRDEQDRDQQQDQSRSRTR